MANKSTNKTYLNGNKEKFKNSIRKISNHSYVAFIVAVKKEITALGSKCHLNLMIGLKMRTEQPFAFP
jgi:hypothetical protein